MKPHKAIELTSLMSINKTTFSTMTPKELNQKK